MTTKPMARFYTVAQVASLLGVSTRSVRRWIGASELLAHKFGRQVRISETELRTFVEKGRTQ
jgi:excisionase family DNA binding protein